MNEKTETIEKNIKESGGIKITIKKKIAPKIENNHAASPADKPKKEKGNSWLS